MTTVLQFKPMNVHFMLCLTKQPHPTLFIKKLNISICMYISYDAPFIWGANMQDMCKIHQGQYIRLFQVVSSTRFKPIPSGPPMTWFSLALLTIFITVVVYQQSDQFVTQVLVRLALGLPRSLLFIYIEYFASEYSIVTSLWHKE